MPSFIEHSLPNTPSLEENEDRKKIEELRTALLECDECCQKYIGADEEKLLAILRVKSFDVKNAAGAIEKNEIFKRKYPEVYSLPFDKYAKAYEKNITNVLRGKDVQGRKILVITLKNWQPSEISLEALTKSATELTEELVQRKEVQMDGIVGVLDIREVGFTQMAKQIATVGFHDARRANDWIKGGSIIKVKAVFILNAPFAFVQLMKAIQFCFSKKVRERLHFCNTESKAFKSNFPKYQLPQSLDGVLNDEEAIDLTVVRNIVTKDKK